MLFQFIPVFSLPWWETISKAMVSVPSRDPSLSDSSKSMGRDTKWERVQSTGNVMKKGRGSGMAEEFAVGSWSNEYPMRAVTAAQQGPSCCVRSGLESPPLNLHSLPLHRRLQKCSLRGKAQWGEISGEDQGMLVPDFN